MKSKMLGALALLTLIGTLFVMQSAQQHAPTADAAAGSIAALNVGTCLTTDATVFKGDCDALSEGAAGTGADGEDIRTEKTEVSTLYATYAHDPKTASGEPRAILMDSDLLKISIADPDRDKRSGVLVRGASNTAAIVDDGTAGLGKVIRDDLVADGLDFDTHTPAANSDPATDQDVIKFTSEEDGTSDGTDGITLFDADGDNTADSIIATSGNKTLNFTRADCDGPTADPCAMDWEFDPGDFDVDDGAVVKFYGCLDGGLTGTSNGSCGDATDDGPIEVLDELTVDEDASNGEASGNTAPWLGVNASVPDGSQAIILAIYYRTSDRENLSGGEEYWSCDDASEPTEERIGTEDQWKCNYVDANDMGTDAVERDGEMNVVYTSNEKDRNTALEVMASADGDDRSANLVLMETERFQRCVPGLRPFDGCKRRWPRHRHGSHGLGSRDDGC